MNHLIVTICNDGSADEVMEVAKKMGAQGGTILKARGSAGKDDEKFAGITIQPGKEVILIIVDEVKKNLIMKEISAQLGVGTKQHSITFSLPVDAALGVTI